MQDSRARLERTLQQGKQKTTCQVWGDGLLGKRTCASMKILVQVSRKHRKKPGVPTCPNPRTMSKE